MKVRCKREFSVLTPNGWDVIYKEGKVYNLLEPYFKFIINGESNKVREFSKIEFELLFEYIDKLRDEKINKLLNENI